jgi:rubrerythrin
MTLGEPDERGRRKPLPTGEVIEMPCDTVIAALGTKANPIVTQSTPGLGLNRWGYIVADEVTQTTSVPGVFAGGDIVTGGATVILAMGAGRRAARSITAYLARGRPWPLTREEVDAYEPPAPVVEAVGCPKCHRPLEGDEPYVCCASARLEWRCDGCAKVSEGFAFPYGLCPACGGHLALLDEARRAEALALEPIRAAFEIELGGRAFYTQAARDAVEPALRALFGRLAGMEDEHLATLTRRYHTEAPPPGEFSIGRAAVFAGLPDHPEDPVNLFRLAIGFEERATQFFAGRLAQVAPGSPEAQLYRELAAEEAEHVALLRTELERFERGQPGLLSL